jgi:L-rhamnonate dehydratase
MDLLGTMIVELESDTGEVGFGITTAGGEIGCWIVERHLARFIEGTPLSEIDRMWDQMFLGTINYGRKGIALNAISAVDLAAWDLLGRVREEPVYQLIGGAVRDEIAFYATGSRPDVAKDLGFIGGKLPLHHGFAEGDDGLQRNLELAADMRSRVGDDFWLMQDCWMSLDLPYALRLADALGDLGFQWIEEPLLPDDYWGYAELKRCAPSGLMVATGEHEATRWGFRLLLEMACCDFIQPDINWCGGLTELLKISAIAAQHRVWVIPHLASVYSYHFVIACPHSPFAEFAMMHPDALEVVPMFGDLLRNEPVPLKGRLRLPDTPGFGVELGASVVLERPFTHPSTLDA